MAFEHVRVRLPDGQEFGPVAWSVMLQWHQEGRVPADASLVDHATGEARAASSFPALQRLEVTPAMPVESYVPPTPVLRPGMAGQYGESVTPPDTSIGAAYAYGNEAFRAQMGLAIGAFLIVAIISGAAERIPYLGLLVAGLLVPPLEGGYTRFNLNLINRRNPQISDIFNGFSAYLTWLAAYWIRTGIALACFLPGILPIIYLVITADDMAGQAEPAAIMGMVIGLLVAVIIAIFVLPRFAFIMYLVAEGYGPIEAMHTSMRMVRNRFGEVLWTTFVLNALAGVGALLCIVGVIFTGPLAQASLAAYYNAVKAQEGVATYR
ncbi:MAG TPA: hypothetical protein PLZ36_00385 [Armatimonadota bacterium]|mgnify:CR=1 FL=1|nr:hypothetical protein [Armatimonadota bacterium]